MPDSDLNVPNIPIRINPVGYSSSGGRTPVASAMGLPIASGYDDQGSTKGGAATTRHVVGGRVNP